MINKLNNFTGDISYSSHTENIDVNRLKQILDEYSFKINELIEYTQMMEKYYDLYIYAKPQYYGGFREWIQTHEFHILSYNWNMCKTDLVVYGIDDISGYLKFLTRNNKTHTLQILEEYKFNKIINKLLE
jgi:hypothetical protein